MLGRAPLRESLLLALQVSVAGAFVLVATVDFVKNDLALPDRFYAWAMAIYGVGSVCGAIAYSRGGTAFRNGLVTFGAPAMISVLALVGYFQSFPILLVAWAVIGAVQSLLGIRGSELLAANSNKEERAHIYAAHFALSHAGWRLTYPLAGVLTSRLGFAQADWIFAGLVTAVAIPYWILHFRRKTSAANR